MTERKLMSRVWRMLSQLEVKQHTPIPNQEQIGCWWPDDS